MEALIEAMEGGEAQPFDVGRAEGALLTQSEKAEQLGAPDLPVALVFKNENGLSKTVNGIMRMLPEGEGNLLYVIGGDTASTAVTCVEALRETLVGDEGSEEKSPSSSGGLGEVFSSGMPEASGGGWEAVQGAAHAQSTFSAGL